MASIAQAGVAQADAAQARDVARQEWRRQARLGAVGPEAHVAHLGWRRVADEGAE